MLLQITQAMSQHHHKQNYMWLNVCNLPEKIILAKKLQKKWIFQILFIPLQAHTSPRHHG